jgi:hypothetical protein
LTATAVWVGLLTLVWIVVRICEQRVSRDAAVGLVPAVVALAVCVGVGLTWQLAGDEPLDPSHSQIDLLSAMRDEPADRLFVLRSGHWLAGEAALARFDVGGQPRRGRVGLAATFLHLDRLPAGTYRLLTQRPAPVKFDVNVGRPAGPRGHRPVAALQLDGTPGAPPATFTLPVDVLDFRVTTDDNAQALGRLSVQPIALRRVRPLPGSATRAARYGRSAVFFLNEAVYPEPNGFWVRGEATAPFAVQTSDGATGVALFLRNGPFPNVVSVRIDGTAQDLSLKPGEERTIAVSPGSTDAAGIEVSSSALFRPRRVDPASTDLRPLGVWVEVR